MGWPRRKRYPVLKVGHRRADDLDRPEPGDRRTLWIIGFFVLTPPALVVAYLVYLSAGELLLFFR